MKGISSIKLEFSFPMDEKIIMDMFEKSKRIVIFEELEPVLEMLIRSLASKTGWNGRIIGKLDGVLPRTGKYSLKEIITGINELIRDGKKGGELSREKVIQESEPPASLTFKHPISFCAGCPHMGTYEALNKSIKKLKLKQDEIIVTGDIGCTIIGMNPPFNSCWTEVSMGSSIGLAQGLVRGGIEKPVIAAIGDSTFFHAGIPPLINAVQHNSDILVIILDNGWTSMTGFQVNPGTDLRFQEKNSKRIDIAAIIRSLGVDYLETIHPFELEKSIEIISRAINAKGVRVVISRGECALPAARRGEKREPLNIDPDKCSFCKLCLKDTGCPALFIETICDKQVMSIHADQCTGCGLCAASCSLEALSLAE